MGKKNNQIMVYILAVIVAIMLRSYVVDKENPERVVPYYSVPITILNEESLGQADLYIVEKNQMAATVRVTGRLRDLSGFSPKDLMVTVDVANYGEGEVSVPVNVTIPDNPGGLRVVSYEPTALDIVIEQNISRTRPVVVTLEGKLRDGFSLISATADQELVTVEGSRSAVNQVVSILAKIDLEQWDDLDVIEATLVPIDETGAEVKTVTLEKDVVPIHVVVKEIIQLPVEIKMAGQLRQGLTLVNVDATPVQIDVTNSSQFSPKTLATEPLRLDELTESGSQTLVIQYPEGIHPVNPEQTDIQVTYTIEMLHHLLKEMAIRDVSFEGEGEYDVILVSPIETISLDIAGSQTAVAQLDEHQLRLFVNVEPRLGQQDLPINIEGLPDNVSCSLTPSTLTVMVVEN